MALEIDDFYEYGPTVGTGNDYVKQRCTERTVLADERRERSGQMASLYSVMLPGPALQIVLSIHVTIKYIEP